MIHVLDFNGNIVDFISLEDNDVIYAKHNRNLNERSETYNLTLLSDSATHFMQKNRVIIQDSNDKYREFIITHIESDDGYTEIEMSASYLEDIAKAKPISPGKYEKMTTSQALDEVLKDTGWQRSEETEYGGIRTTSWTSYQTRYEVLLQLCTTYTMSLDFYIELGSNRVKGRYVSLKEKNPLFKGKEIVKGKDLTSMKRIVELDEIRTGLLCIGPEKDDGSRIEVIVTDDEAQEQFGLPERYIWGIYEPESDDANMTAARLKTLGTTELNKRKVALISYEVTAFDIKKESPHEIVNIGDKVRIKDRDFNPPLYVEAEVIGEEYDPISKDSTYTFGQYKEYNENDLRVEFNKKLSSIQQKLNNNINNSNTIITDRIEEEIERLQRTIQRGETPPTNPEEGDFWYDTTNPKVAVLREFVDGEWRNASAHDVEQIGGMTKEAIIYNEVNGTFITLSVQHAKITNEVYEALNSEYLVDEDIRTWLNNELDGLNNIFDSVRDLLESMTSETATIGKLMDTQSLIVQYREKIYVLNNALLNARKAIDARFKLLQSQYTEEKYNEAMQKVADVIGGTFNVETGQLIADIPNKEMLEEMRVTIEKAMNDMSQENTKKIQELQEGITQTNQRITSTNEELSAGITSVTNKVDGMQVGGRNLLIGTDNLAKFIKLTGVKGNSSIELLNTSRTGNMYHLSNIERTSINSIMAFAFKDIAPLFGVDLDEHVLSFYIKTNNEQKLTFLSYNTETLSITPTLTSDKFQKVIVKLKPKAIRGEVPHHNGNLYLTGTGLTDLWIYDIKLEKGNVATDWTPAPEDSDKQLSDIKASVQTQSADISVLKDGIKLKADNTEVTKIYNDYLTPLQTQVNQQKASLDVLPSQIAAKVSQSQYTADMNNVVGRLNNAEAESVVMSNQIKDRVTINEYNNMKIGTRNLVANSDFSNGLLNWRNVGSAFPSNTFDTTQTDLPNSLKNVAIVESTDELNKEKGIAQDNLKLEVGKEYILSAWIKILSGGTRVSLQEGKTRWTDIVFDASPEWQRYEFKFTAVESNTNVYILRRKNTPNNKFAVTGVQVIEGNRNTDWKASDKDTDTRLNTMQTSIEQNGQAINLKASKEELNNSKKTLSRVLADLTIDTIDGLSLTYDENGSITSHVVGPNGVKIKGNRVDIQANKEFSVLVQDTNNKVGKNEIINSLNLSQEGLDINVNNIGIRGGDSLSYVNLINDTIELNGKYSRMWRGSSSTNTVKTVMKNGYLSFSNYDQNKKLSISDFGISTFLDGSGDDLTSGTIEFFSTEYSSVRGLTLFSAGVLGLQSNSNQIMIDSYASTNIESRQSPIYFRPYKKVRPGYNTFALTIANESEDYKTHGYILYGSDVNGYASGLRFYKASSNPRVEVVDGNSTGGGNATLEAGIGEFNLIKRRTGNDYIGVQSYDILIAGSDSDGDRLASNAVYKRTYSYGANVYVTSFGTLGRATSASKYKLDIEDQYNTEDEQLDHSKSILDLKIKHWFDKTESETYAKEISAGKRLSDDFFIIKRHSGLIAEEVEKVGLSEFVTYGSDGEIEGIQYDRLWVHLIPIIKEQQNRIKQLEEIINE
ncbi:phage tail spike protein [Mammaliicoccus sciuri]|uniref:phage tail spike protein n=1 Tax=Mammaliicoccus sciuri TaxID=1296 RepID=UPI003CC5523D